MITVAYWGLTITDGATPLRHRQAAAALGVTRSGFVRRVLLPSAAPGMAVGVILSVGGSRSG